MVDRQRSQTLRRLKRSAALCALACVVGVSATALADKPAKEKPPEAAGAQDEGPERRQLGYILLGTSCALGVGMVGAFLLIRRRRRQRQMWPAFGQGTASGAQLIDVSEYDGPNVRSQAGSREQGGVGADTLMEALGGSKADFAATEVAGPKRRCPECSRTYPATLLVCPYDSAKLLRMPERRSRRSRRSRKQTGLERRVCTGCERRYEAHVDYCYHDGLPLMQDTRERSYEAPAFVVCKSCGWEGEGEEEVCPNDGSELVEIDPSDATPVPPAFPMTICPTCRQYGSPGEAFCADDGEVLMPVVDMRETEFPPHGFGPRRKVCSECGAEHGGHASYCSNDGTKLVALN